MARAAASTRHENGWKWSSCLGTEFLFRNRDDAASRPTCVFSDYLYNNTIFCCSITMGTTQPGKVLSRLDRSGTRRRGVSRGLEARTHSPPSRSNSAECSIPTRQITIEICYLREAKATTGSQTRRINVRDHFESPGSNK